MKLLRRVLVALVLAAPLGLLPTNASADSTVVGMVPCIRAGHTVSLAAGSPITLVSGWGMSTRGNLVDFVNAATMTFTIDGQVVTPTQSDITAAPGADSGTGEDFWRVVWRFDTAAPSAGQTIVWTTSLALTRMVVDHELIEFGLAGPGRPAMLQPGVLFGPPQAVCNITGA